MENLDKKYKHSKHSLNGLNKRLEIIDLNSNAPIIILNVTSLITIIRDMNRMSKQSKTQLRAAYKKPI